MFGIPNGQLAPQVQPANMVPSTWARYGPAVGSRRGRVYMCHGITSSPSASFGPQGSNAQYTVTQNLVADGWEPILVSYAEDFQPAPGLPAQLDLRDDPLLGQRWLNTTLFCFDTLKAEVEAAYGAIPSVVLGVSWGGWHTLQIAANRWSELIGFVAHAPVTVIGNGGVSGPGLTLLGGGVYSYPFATSAADATIGIINAVRIPGLLRIPTEASSGATLVTDPYYSSQLGTAAIGAGVTLASRVITDGAISGGNTLSSTQAAFLSNPYTSTFVENGVTVTGPGVPAGTTISNIAGSTPGPWTCTLSQACTNGSGLTLTFPTLVPTIDEAHLVSTADAAAIQAWFSATLDPSYPAVL